MLPQEFLKRMENMLGEEYPAFLKSYDIARYQALRLNPQKGDDASFLNRGVFSLERVPWAEHGYYYTAKDTPGKHPYHEAGVYYIQEPSAMAPAAYLTRQMADGAGERILDLCAAPGGKSTQIAAAMEGKRLGLCRKNLVVVPNHLTEQWGADFLRLYPGAKVLVATKKDFEPQNRKKFCSRIATGDYDAVVIGHSQFEKIPLSPERQKAILREQIDQVIDGIEEAKAQNGERYTIKQLEKSRKSLQAKLEKLNDQSRKDDVVTFEELGVEKLFVDEAHGFKNRAKRCV